LEFIHRYSIAETDGELGPWKASSAEYVYRLLDHEQNTIVAYHWHPHTGSRAPHPIVWPHLHVSGPGGLRRVHLPTGRVSVESVVRLAILDLQVEPRRKDWREVLENGQKLFERLRTWC
jgi:hypothetical protein